MINDNKKIPVISFDERGFLKEKCSIYEEK